MQQLMRRYIAIVDAMNHRIGRMMMYGIFVMMAILLWSSVSKTFFVPSLWTLEVAQFAMVAYYMLGGRIRSRWDRMCGWICCMANGPIIARRRLMRCR